MSLSRQLIPRALCATAAVALAAALWGVLQENDGPTAGPVTEERTRRVVAPPIIQNAVSKPVPDDAVLATTGAKELVIGDRNAPIYSEEILLQRARAQARILGNSKIIEDRYGRVGPSASSAKRKRRRRNGNTLGAYVPVENEKALAHFHESLDAMRTAPGTHPKVRVAAYGASHTQADIYSGYLRYYLQSRFGNGGVGFIPIGLQKSWSRRLDYRVKNSSSMQVRYAQQRKSPRKGPLGLAGSAGISRPGGTTEVRPKSRSDLELQASHFDLFYASQPRGGELDLSINGKPFAHLSGRSSKTAGRYYHFEQPLGWHTIRLKTSAGPVRLFGLTAERDEPGVVVDTLGIRGTRAANMLLWDEALWAEHLQKRAPDLVMFAYGTNETTDRGEAMTTYRRRLSEVLRRMRKALPATSCVLVGPGDFPKGKGANWVPRPRLLKIIGAQRSVADEFNCGFWNTYAFMGGAGSMHEWTRSKPQMGAGDHIHFTRRGYVRMGMALGDALMRAYDERHIPGHARVASQRESFLLPEIGSDEPTARASTR